MCLIAVAWQTPGRPLLVAANRDEAHARPTAAAAWWPDAPHVLAGRDLVAGGTWLGIDHAGRFAAVTNLAAGGPPGGLRSRGTLVADFLLGSESAPEYATRIAAAAHDFGPFNLLVADREALWFVGTRSRAQALPPGVHAVSNVEPGVDWPKVTAARDRTAQLASDDQPDAALFALLAERRPPANGFAERQVSPFQLDPAWGTRSSTVIRLEADQRARFIERSFDSAGRIVGEARYEFTAARALSAGV